MEVVSKKPLQELVRAKGHEYMVLDADGHVYLVSTAEGAAKITAKKLSEMAERARRELLRALKQLNESKPDSIPWPSDGGPPIKAVEGLPVGSVSSGIEPEKIDDLMDRAAEVLGSRDEGMRWLGTPIRGLDFATPISILATKDGAVRVNDILGQMEHGIW